MNCIRCNHFNSDYNYKYCTQCSAPNPNNPDAIQGGHQTVLASEAPQIPILVQDKYVEGVGIEVVQIGAVGHIEAGALLAIVPQRPFGGGELEWFLILRRPIGDEITKLRKELADRREAAKQLTDQADAAQKKLEEATALTAEIRGSLTFSQESHQDALDEREKACALRQKLEAHIGAIREAVGNKQMDEILRPLVEAEASGGS